MFIASTSYVGGDVVIGDESTVMHQVTIRGDIAPIRIGARVNIQDGAILHTPHGTPLVIGDDVSVGHRAVVHCRSIAAQTLIGIGSVLLDGCRIGSRCIIAAGALIPPDTVVPSESVVMGFPGRVVREVNDEDLETIDHVTRSYLDIGRMYADNRFPNIAGR